MWISRAKYQEMCERIVALEKRQAISFGCIAYSNHFTPKFIARSCTEADVAGEPVQLSELVCAIANHLGFTYKNPDRIGEILPPGPKKEPDPLAQTATGATGRKSIK